MSEYRYLTTNLVTGQVLADAIPLRVKSFSSALGGVGQPGGLAAVLDLGALSPPGQFAMLEALEPRRSMLWALQDGNPVWAGPVWDWQHSSIVSNQLPIAATEIGSLFSRRQVRSNQVYTTVDLFAVVQGLFNYALGKTGGSVANLMIGTATSGATATITFNGLNLPKVLDSVNQFCAQYNVEYHFAPHWDPAGTVPQISLLLGHPTLSRPYADTNLQLLYPSAYVLDYAFPRIGRSSVNSLLATASQSGAIPWRSGAGGGTHGYNAADIAAGYPLLEDSIAYTAAAVTTQAQIDAYADGKLPLMTGCTTVPSVKVGGGGIPRVGQVRMGDEAMLIATSPLHPADPNSGAPGLQQLVRIIGWTVSPSAEQQPETTLFALGGVTT